MSSWSDDLRAGAATLVRDYFLSGFYPSGVRNSSAAFTPSGALVKAMLINSAIPLSGFIATGASILTPVGNQPYLDGFGRIQLASALRFSDSSFNLWVVNNDRPIRNANDVHSFCFRADLSAQDLKVSLLVFFLFISLSTAFLSLSVSVFVSLSFFCMTLFLSIVHCLPSPTLSICRAPCVAVFIMSSDNTGVA